MASASGSETYVDGVIKPTASPACSTCGLISAEVGFCALADSAATAAARRVLRCILGKVSRSGKDYDH